MGVKSILNLILKVSIPTLFLYISILLAYSCKSSDPESETQSSTSYRFPEGFLFGLATAPGHAEDQLEDAWARLAQQGGIPAFAEIPRPYERLKFWSNPGIEIRNAAETGIDIYRWGIDWQRLVPHKPGSTNCPSQPQSLCGAGIQDMKAWNYYVSNHFSMLRAKGLKSMLTLFHHSGPRWFVDSGGWTRKENMEHFVSFVRSVLGELQSNHDIDVAYWITINEPSLMALMSYVIKSWPHHFDNPGTADISWWQKFSGTVAIPDYFKAVDNMIEAHNQAYELIKNIRPSSEKVGFAKNLAYFSPYHEDHQILTPLEKGFVKAANKQFHDRFLDATVASSDFIGINYYGEEFLSMSGLGFREDREYMDSGRAISTKGFYDGIKRLVERYGERDIFVTENGISDEQDVLRPAYFLEHLAVLRQLINEGVPILGYNFWTLSDNWEWGDGYCPKFGMLSVDRSDPSLSSRSARTVSYELFKQIMQTRAVTPSQRSLAWSRILDQVGNPRPLCRASDGQSPLDEPNYTIRNYVKHDWRFNEKALENR